MFVSGVGLPTLWPVVVLPREHISNLLFYKQGPEVPSASGAFPSLVEQAAGRWPTGTEKVQEESRDPKIEFTLYSGSSKCSSRRSSPIILRAGWDFRKQRRQKKFSTSFQF